MNINRKNYERRYRFFSTWDVLNEVQRGPTGDKKIYIERIRIEMNDLV